MEISSKDIGLYFNVAASGEPADWKLVACSTSDGFSGSTDNVTVSNKCKGGWTSNLPGDSSWSFNNTSYAQKTPEANQLSQEEVFELWAAKTVGTWKLESINEDEYLRQGEGYISDLGETADSGDYLQFNLTITGNGEVVNSIGT